VGPSDRELLVSARTGSHGAFDQLVARHGPMVLRLARSVVSHAEDAEDVAQEVFLRFYRTLERVDPARPVEPWLVRITLNTARSLASRRPQRREAALSESRSDPAGSDDAASAVHSGELRSALSLAMGELGEKEREVFALRDLHQFEVATIAQALGVTEITVRRQSSSARRKITAWFRRHRPELLS
jgi:RNA polymerase sigma-70 factor (ECF subfamily)